MARILADLPEQDIRWLDARAAEQGKSRASLLREAVTTFKAHATVSGKENWIERGAGLWRDREEIPDGVEYQQAIREDRTRHSDI